ncbi:MAG: hypothetical protein P1U85_01045 [Verrucomicrobiales bacterium]|nr:hypothetical protein [Verrucomicrobiales bacterium]
MRRPIPLLVCFAIPLLLLIIGAAFAGVYGFREIPKLLDETARGMVPQGFVAQLGSPGKYTVWLYERGQIGAEFYRGTEKLPPGARIYLYDEASGREMEVSKWLNSSKTLGHERAVSLGSFSGLREGQRVEVKGSGFSKPVLISIAPENTGRVLRVVFILLGMILLALSVSITVFLVLLHRRNQAIESEFAR